MKFGFAKVDITPRLGVELYGYSGYLNRYAGAVRGRLWVRAMAMDDGENRFVMASGDVVFVTAAVTARVREAVSRKYGIPEQNIMLHATHTHSGPCVQTDYRNAYDPPWNELFPLRIAEACGRALEDLRESDFQHATIPCEGIACNRVHDTFNHGEVALAADFRPAKPELTDTRCQVFSVVDGSRVRGFISSFGCHPVIGGKGSTYIHGDYPGIAHAALEEEYPGAVGIFLLAAAGDINPAGCCFGDDLVLQALDIVSARYAAAVRRGIQSASRIETKRVSTTSLDTRFSRMKVPVSALRERLAEEQAVIDTPGIGDGDQRLRWAALRVHALRFLISKVEAGHRMDNSVSLQGLSLGPLALLTAPLEIFNAIRQDVEGASRAGLPLVLGLTNDEQGYAPDRIAAAKPNDYASTIVPLWKYTLPYAKIHEELVEALLRLDTQLAEA